MKRLLRHTMMLAFVAAGAACGSADPSGSPTSSTPSELTTQTAPFNRTIVTLNKDGTEVVKHFLVSDEQREQEAAERRTAQAAGGRFAPEIAQDGSCKGADIWLYNCGSCAGHNVQEICFYGSGTANLANYRSVTCGELGCIGSGCPTWATQTLSYWPGYGTGAENGYFSWFGGGYTNFSANQSCTNSNWGSNAAQLTLD